VREHTLGESLSSGSSSQGGGESERFSDGQVSSDNIGGGSLDLFFFDNSSSSLIENIIDSSHRIGGGGNFGNKDGFLESRAGGKFTTIIDSSGSGDDLTTSSMNGIGVENDIHKIDFDGSHVFVGHDGFFGGPLESILHGIFDFIHELDSLGGINEDVSSVIFGSVRPNFEGIIFFPSIDILKMSGSFFRIGFRTSSFISFNIFGKIIFEGGGLGVKSVMFVGGFGEADLAGNFSNGFFEGNDRVGFDNFNVGEFGLEIVETNFNMEFSTTSDNMFTSFFSSDENQGIGFGEFFKSIDQFGEIRGVFGFDCNSHDRGD